MFHRLIERRSREGWWANLIWALMYLWLLMDPWGGSGSFWAWLMLLIAFACAVTQMKRPTLLVWGFLSTLGVWSSIVFIYLTWLEQWSVPVFNRRDILEIAGATAFLVFLVVGFALLIYASWPRAIEKSGGGESKLNKWGRSMKCSVWILFAGLLVFSELSALSFEEFGKALNYFYLKPTQSDFETLQKDADTYLDKLTGAGNGADVLIAVWVARISKKHGWPIVSKTSIGQQAKKIMEGKDTLARYVLDDKKVDASKLDIWWVSFLATGEESYLDNLLVYAGEELKKGDVELMVIQAAATWSFKSNCMAHESIRKYAEKKLKSGKYPAKKAFLEECLSFPPENKTESPQTSGKTPSK